MAFPASATRPEAAPQAGPQYPEFRRGVLLGVVAYGMWGMFPLYWTLLQPAAATEILAHRIAWSLLAVLAALWFAGRRRGTGMREFGDLLRSPRRLLLLSVAAVVISVNWGTYIWAVNHGHVVETSLGYFINPLVTVVVGVLVLGERLRGAQWAAVGLGSVAVVVLTVGYGRLPWIALILAGSFAFYGLAKKFASVGAAESQLVETAVLVLPAVGYLAVLEASGAGTFTGHGAGHALLLAGSGLVSAAPLLAFGGATLRMPLSVLGLLQYLAPVLQFALGVLVFAEQMPPERWFGFALVWLALTILTWDGLRAVRRRRQPPIPPAEPC